MLVKRRAQLVRGVGQEAPQLLLGGGALRERHLDLVEHRVEAEAEPAHLRAPLGRLDALRQVAGGDGVGGVGHRLQRPQVALDEQPGGHAEADEHEREHEDLDAEQAVEVCVVSVSGTATMRTRSPAGRPARARGTRCSTSRRRRRV